MDIYAAALPGCPGLGAQNIRELIDHFNTPEDVWNASEKDSIDLHVLTPAREKAFLKYRRETDLEKLEKKLLGLGIRWCTWEDSTYPSLLAETSNPPAVLYYMGNSPVFEKTIGIVGSRKATAYGIETAGQFARVLSKEGVTVVSGGARGIDSAAHSGALQEKGSTVVVMACGLDKVYPPENRNLFQQVIDNGGTLLSEYPPGTPPLGRQFPARNRIIAGMSRGVIVVEAAERSGSLITSDFALEEGRDVFSVPGSIWIDSCKGTNQLIRNGAICCTSAEDVLSEYNWKEEKGKPESKYLEPLTIEEEYVFHFCQTEGEVNSEDILQHSGFSVVKLTMILLQLQLKGYIQETEQGRYIIKTGL